MSVIKKSRHFAQSPLKLIRFVLSADLVFARNIMIVVSLCILHVYICSVCGDPDGGGVTTGGGAQVGNLRGGLVVALPGGGTPKVVVGTPWQPAPLNRRGC